MMVQDDSEITKSADMLRILLLCALALAESRYLEDQGLVERVVGGDVAKPHSWPWQASLIHLYNGYQSQLTCGGVLIRKRWVLTAANCIDYSKEFRVLLGDHELYASDETEQIMVISNIYVHPKWNSHDAYAGYDIALIELSSEATLDAYVQLATLPPSGQILPHGNICYITGWGRISVGGSMSLLLRQARLPVVDYNTCSSSEWWGKRVKDTMVCAGGGRLSACQGDLGGPLNCQVNGEYVVHGVASFVPARGCNLYKKPTVFTRVSEYINWIDEIVGQEEK